MTEGPRLTRAERESLMKVARLRSKVARNAVATREAELLADVEEQLSAAYQVDDDAWADVTRLAEEAVRRADAEIAQRCRDLGIPERFRPGLDLRWYGRGENGTASRRAELRKRAQTRIAATGKAARAAIEARESEVLVELLADGLTSQEGSRWLAAIPSPADLMPPVPLAELESAPDAMRGSRGPRPWLSGATVAVTDGGTP